MRSSPTPNEVSRSASDEDSFSFHSKAPHGDAVVNDITIDDPELPPAASVPPTPVRRTAPFKLDVR